jgi:PAS domain S-box-containing protein
MVLKELLPDTIIPFRAEMAALREVERQRQARLVQVFSAVTFGVDFTALFVSLVASISDPNFFTLSLVLLSFFNIIVSGISYRLSATGQIRKAAQLLLVINALSLAYAYFMVGTAFMVPVVIVLNILIAAILLETIEVVLLTAFWMAVCAFLFFFQNHLAIYKPPIVLGKGVEDFFNLALLAVVLPSIAISLIIPARSLVEILRTRSQRLEKLLEQQIVAEALLQENEQRLRATFDQVSVGIAYIDREGVCLAANPKIIEMFGYSVPEILGTNFQDLTFPEDKYKGQQQFEEIWDGKLPNFSQDKRFVRKDGSLLWCNTNTSPVKDLEGQTKYFISVMTDITDRKQAEEDLAAEKERLAVTLRSIGEGVITTDTAGRVVLLNPVAEKFTGWSQAEAAGRPLPEVFHIVDEKTRQLAPNPAEHVLRTGEIIGLASQTILVGRDGHERYVSNNGAPIRDLSDKVEGVVLVFRDITERQRSEAELRKVQKLESLGLLAGGIAHDFNNILTAIAGNISLAKMDVPARSSVYEVLAGAENATFRAKDLTQQLLTFSQGGAPIKKTTSLKELLEGSVSFALRGSNVQAKFDIPANLWPVDIDSGQINQVLNNLVINADQAMPEGGLLTVSAKNVPRAKVDRALNLQGENYVLLSFKDQGLGIPQKNLNRIFDPYFTTKQKGSGLGLASCYSIIARHEGVILVESELGKGTTFCIYLPATPGKAAPLEPAAASAKPGKGKILLMDDDDMILQLSRRLLDRLGYNVETARDGTEAIVKYRAALEQHQPFDLVIMDLTVKGGMGGKEAMLHLKKLDPNVRSIVSSGYSTDPIMADYTRYHFNEILSKPFRVEELTEKIEKVLRGD